jgi:pyruvate dehydrogenase E1 component beta subunit
LESDPRVFLIGQGVTSPWYVGKTTQGLLQEFGPERIIDTPVSENAITGSAIGAALVGMRPIVVHPRMDFMYYAFDTIANHAAPWFYMFGGNLSVPVVIWGIINRGGEQAAQHSQALHAIFTHIPGLKVVMPSTPYDAKGLLVAAIRDPNPVVFIDDRWLYTQRCPVPEELYEVPIGKGDIKKSGCDVTLIATSFMVHEALNAASLVGKKGIDVEVIDPRSLKPFDTELLVSSVKKTGRLIIADGGWKTCGIAAEIAARIAETNLLLGLKVPIKRITLPDIPAPASATLENHYYRRATDLVSTIQNMMEI